MSNTTMNTTTRFARGLAIALALGSLAACGGDEDDPMAGGHSDVAGAAIYRDGVPVTGTLALDNGADTRLEVRFLDEGGSPIDGLRPGHDASLSFEPASLATVTDASDDAGFFFDLEVGTTAGASGVVLIGYGHAGATDELTFGPIDVVIE